MNKPVFVIGAAITDIFGFSGGLIAGDSVPGRIRLATGGVARNMAENLARLGRPVELVAAFGGDMINELLYLSCEEAGVGVRHCLQLPDASGAVNISILNPENDLHASIVDLEIMQLLTLEYLQAIAPHWADAAALVLETNVRADALQWLLDQHNSPPIYLDPVSVTMAAKVKHHLANVHTLKGNRMQTAALTGTPLDTQTDLERAAHQLLDVGVQRVFITLGADGALAADRKEMLHLPAFPANVANTTGAGDAFMAGVIWADARGLSLRETLRSGQAAAAITIQNEPAVNPALTEAALCGILELPDF